MLQFGKINTSCLSAEQEVEIKKQKLHNLQLHSLDGCSGEVWSVLYPAEEISC